MSKPNHSKMLHVLEYPKHKFSPAELLHFIETKPFTKAWDDLGLNDEEDLSALQILMMLDPKRAPVVPGTGGLRKLRFSPPGWNVGAQGALRVCYVFFEDAGIVLLSLVYPKGEQDDLSEQEKKACKRLIEISRAELEKRPIRIKPNLNQ